MPAVRKMRRLLKVGLNLKTTKFHTCHIVLALGHCLLDELIADGSL